MMFLLRLKTLLRLMLLPPTAPLLLAWYGLLIRRRHPTVASCALFAAIASLTLLSMPVVSGALTALVDRYPALDLSGATSAQAIVILGGGGQRAFAPEYGEAAAKPYLLERLEYGAFLAHKTSLPVLVTGFQVEATAMRATLRRSFDINARWIDDQSYDTFENARHTAALLKPEGVRRIILVTSAPHLWRASHEFAAAGFDVVPAPIGLPDFDVTTLTNFIPDADSLVASRAAIYELLGEPVRQLMAAIHLRRQ